MSLSLRLLNEQSFTDAKVTEGTRSDGGSYWLTARECKDLGRPRMSILVKVYRGKVNAVAVKALRNTLAGDGLIDIIATTRGFPETAAKSLSRRTMPL